MYCRKSGDKIESSNTNEKDFEENKYLKELLEIKK